MSEIHAPYPFVREIVPDFEGTEAGGEVMSWRPGTRSVYVYPDDAEAVADGMGCIVLTEVSRHKPGRYPERVFYVRSWIDPDGRRFGKGALRMTTATAFERLCKGYRHEFAMFKPSRDAIE